MNKLSKTLKRAVVVESAYLGKPKLAIIVEMERAYEEMVRGAVEHAVESNARSQANL